MSTYEEQLNHKAGEVLRITTGMDTHDWGSFTVLRDFNLRVVSQLYQVEIDASDNPNTHRGSISAGLLGWLEREGFLRDLKEETLWLGSADKLSALL